MRGVAEKYICERVVGPGRERHKQPFLCLFQHSDVIEDQRLPDARGLASRIDAQRPRESAQRRAILKFLRGDHRIRPFAQ